MPLILTRLDDEESLGICPIVSSLFFRSVFLACLNAWGAATAMVPAARDKGIDMIIEY